MPANRSLSQQDRQLLNPLDRAMWRVDRSLRDMGYPGFETQMLVWMSGRLDVARLRRAIHRLGRRHPAITSRLIESDEFGREYWQFEPGAEARLDESELSSARPEQVLAYAEELLSRGHDPARERPVQFHLLHRPDGRDVFLMQYSHVLMDNNATLCLLRELERLSQPTAADDDAPRPEPGGLIQDWLKRIPRATRRAASRRAIEIQARTLRGRAAILGTGEERLPRLKKLRVLTRTIQQEEARAIRDRVVKVCGMPTLSMAILASALRAIRQLGPEERNMNRNYIAGLGLDLNLRAGRQLLFQNLASIVAISARGEELADRQTLIRMLSRQMRDRLQSRIDAGVLRLITLFQRRPQHIRWVAEHLLRWGYSLWYAYFGSLDAVGSRLCGSEIEKVFYIGPTWPPMGIALLANEFRGRLHFQATYDPQVVSQSLANAFLDAVLDDLRGLIK